MPHLQLPPRSVYPFCTGLVARVTDLNDGGHLGNDRLPALIHQARVSFLAQQGWSEFDCAGVGLIMTDAAIQYCREAYVDDDLDIEVDLAEASRE